MYLLRRNSGSSAGFTLLELSLAAAISMAFMSAFFLGYQAFNTAQVAALANIQAQTEGGDLMRQLCSEIDAATSITSIDPAGMQLVIVNAAGNTVTFDLKATAPASPSAHAWLSRTEGANYVVYKPMNMIVNYNPFGQLLLKFDNTAVALNTDTVPFFTDRGTGGPGAGRVQAVSIQMVLERTIDGPPIYLKGVGTPRSPD